MSYPSGFARRLVEYLWLNGRGTTADLDEGWVEYAATDDDSDEFPLGGRVYIADSEIEPIFDAVVAEGQAFYRKEMAEDAAMIIMAVHIGELLATDERPSPRHFRIGEVFRDG